MKYRVILYHNNFRQDITDICLDGIDLNHERTETPSKLSLSLIEDTDIGIAEGDCIELYINDEGVFKGYVFNQKHSDDKIKITCYDQLRYFKNKDTYIFENKKASEIIKAIAEDFNVKCGTIEDTGYIIASRVEQNKTLFDIASTAIDITLEATKKMFVLYDDFGKLTLKNMDKMYVNLVLNDKDTATDIDYSTDIDSDTYNRVKLYRDNKESGRRDIYIAQDSSTIGQWGLLQHYEKAENGLNDAQIRDYAQRLLKQKNRVKKTLKISCVGLGNGEHKIRGGSSIFIKSDKYKLNNWFVCENVEHSFSDGLHELDITVYDF